MKKFLIVTGPSAVGKSTLVNYILNSQSFYLSISYTTRSPRPWEVNGVHYYFVSTAEFEQKIKDGFFLEHTFFSGNHYGTPSHLDVPDRIIVFDIDIRGHRFFKERFPGSYFCLITADRQLIEGRLENRMRIQAGTVDRRELHARMQSFDDFEEIKGPGSFNKIIDNSGTLQEGFLQADVLIECAAKHFHE